MARLTISEIPVKEGEPPAFQVRNRDTDIAAAPSVVPDPHQWPVEGAGDEPLMTQLRWYLENFLSYPFDPYTQRAERIETALKAWGTAAFEALFDNRSAGSWIPSDAGASFDLTLTFDQPRLLAWPWEALHDRATGYFGHRARIQRRLSKDAPNPSPLPENLPRDCIHILLVTARPYDNDVDYRSISRPLVDLVRAEKLPVTVEVLRPPTFENLRRHLAANMGRYHILHFDGHGGYGSKTPEPPEPGNMTYLRGAEGRLLFEDAKGKPDEIAADKLGTLLAGCGIPFVVLNACRSAALDNNAHENTAFASVAGALVKAGFRGALAMSHNITVAGAAQFLPAFYRELFASGNLLDAARAGRLRMVENPRRSAWNPEVELKDWLLPVVYQQRDDFDLSFAAQAKPPEAPFALPESMSRGRIDNFVGRDAAIHALERQWRKPVPGILIHGLGGIGKTTLALHFIEWLRDTGGLKSPPFWFSFDDIRSASHVFNVLGRALFGPDFDGDRPERVTQLSQALVESFSAVIVWDNFESARGFAAERSEGLLSQEDLARLKDFVSALRGGKTKILITSRGREEWLPERICHRLRLAGLRGDELWEYAAGIVDELDLSIDRKNAETRGLLEDKLAGHPALIRAVLSQLKDGDIAALAKRVDEGLSQFLEFAPEGDAEHGRLLGALTVVESSFSEQERSYLSPIALHERFIRLDDVQQMGEHSGTVATYDHSAMAQVFAKLESAGLLSEMGQNVFSIHPLLTSYLRTKPIAAVRPGNEAQDWPRAFIWFMANLADHYTPKELHEQRRVFQIHHANFHNALALASALRDENSFAALMQALAAWALDTRDFSEANRLYLALAEKDKELNSPQGEAAAYHQLGRTAQEQRDFEQARRWYLKSLEIKERQGNEHGAARTYHQLGILAQEKHDFEQARNWFLKSLEIKERQGNEHEAANTYLHLGIIAQLQRNLEQARNWCLKCLLIRERQNNQKCAASAYHQLGIIAQLQCDFDQARNWYLKSLEINERQGYGHDAARTYYQLGIIAQEQGGFDQARTWYLKSLEIKERLGDEHGTAIPLGGLAELAAVRRDFEEAGSFALKALARLTAANDLHTAQGTTLLIAAILAAAPTEAASKLRTAGQAALGKELMTQIEILVSKIQSGEL